METAKIAQQRRVRHKIQCWKWLSEPDFAHILSVDSGWLNLFEVGNSWSTFGDSN